MKMESNPTTPTIAELWLEFEAHNEFIEERTFLLQQETDGDFDPYRESAAKDIVWRQGRIDALRAQLIERCVLEYGLKIHSEADGSAWIYETWISPTRICGINDTRNRAASLNFMAWELEQRQRESTATAETTQQQP